GLDAARAEAARGLDSDERRARIGELAPDARDVDGHPPALRMRVADDRQPSARNDEATSRNELGQDPEFSGSETQVRVAHTSGEQALVDIEVADDEVFDTSGGRAPE